MSNQSEYAPAVKVQLKGWAANKKAFLNSRSNRRSTTLYDLIKRVELACRFLEKSSNEILGFKKCVSNFQNFLEKHTEIIQVIIIF